MILVSSRRQSPPGFHSWVGFAVGGASSAVRQLVEDTLDRSLLDRSLEKSEISAPICTDLLLLFMCLAATGTVDELIAHSE